MATHTEIQDTCDDRMEAQIETPYAIQVGYDNEEFEPDEDNLGTYEVWMLFHVLMGDSFQTSSGQHPRFRTPGVCIVSVFGKPLIGKDKMNAAVDLIIPKFRAVKDGSVVFYTPRAKNGRRDGRWWRVNVECPFYADDIGS